MTSPRTPTRATLRKYGITESEWLDMLYASDAACGVCGRSVEVLCIDHVHVKGWKRMPPEERKLYIRGLACRFCNRVLLARGITPLLARAAAAYLDRGFHFTGRHT